MKRWHHAAKTRAGPRAAAKPRLALMGPGEFQQYQRSRYAITFRRMEQVAALSFVLRFDDECVEYKLPRTRPA